MLILTFHERSFADNASTYQKYFDACNVSGSTTLYDLKKNKWFKTDEQDSAIQTLPASTFKIINSLIALEEGATSTKEIFKWDGTKRSIDTWNQDTTLRDAFKHSTVWVYEILASRMSKDVYSRYLNQTHYSNGDIEHGKNGNFWVYGSFGVSPIEQINMLIKLYKDELPFSEEVMDTVKSFMLVRDNNEIRTFGKSGMTESSGQNIGWWIGYREFPDRPIFFATRIIKSIDEELNDFIACRKLITEHIISDYIAYAK